MNIKLLDGWLQLLAVLDLAPSMHDQELRDPRDGSKLEDR